MQVSSITDPDHPEQLIRKRRTRRSVGPAPGVPFEFIQRILSSFQQLFDKSFITDEKP